MQQNERGASTSEEAFGTAVRKRRTDVGLSQRDLGQLMTEAGFSAVDGPAISRIEKGSRQVRLGEAVALAEILETSVESLVYQNDPRRALESLRNESDIGMRQMILAASSYARSLISVRDFLAHSPELLADLSDEEFDPPMTPDDYFSWVLHRVKRLATQAPEYIDAAAILAQESDPRHAEVLRAILSINAARAVITDEREEGE